MEFCEHGDLSGFIWKRKGKLLSENTIWKLFIQICIGLYALHSKNIMHRDLKSLNIFLGKNNSIRIGDMGVAIEVKTEDGFLEKTVGTPYYLSPELSEGKPYNYKSDIWAIGCILYELSALKLPF
jgi:NIMA (never in mitosis gene a)-related kinase